MDSYFQQPEVSNSDLTELKKYFMTQDHIHDVQSAYRFGTLVDAIITEPGKVDYFNRYIRGHDYLYTEDEFAIAKLMLNSFRKHPICAEFLKHAQFQYVNRLRGFEIQHEGVDFTLDVRCKWDLWMPHVRWGGDIKSTACTSQKQFEASIDYFDYDRQRAWYMDIARARKDVLIGISKVNFKVFIVAIDHGHKFYKSGCAKYQELAFKWWTLFHDFKVEETYEV